MDEKEQVKVWHETVVKYRETYAMLYNGKQPPEKMVESFCKINKIPWPLPREERKMIDADIYLDVDGVLFTTECGIFELRDGFIGFLWFLVNTFENCYWLTCWEDSFNEVLKKVYAGKIAAKFKWASWDHSNKDGKATGIQDWSRPFVWIEDGISEREMEVLKQHGCENNYIHVPYKGEMHKLYEIKEELKRRFNITEA